MFFEQSGGPGIRLAEACDSVLVGLIPKKKFG
jgi:hypothetical protein